MANWTDVSNGSLVPIVSKLPRWQNKDMDGLTSDMTQFEGHEKETDYPERLDEGPGATVIQDIEDFLLRC